MIKMKMKKVMKHLLKHLMKHAIELLLVIAFFGLAETLHHIIAVMIPSSLIYYLIARLFDVVVGGIV